MGNPYFVRCTKASVSDDDGLLAMIREDIQYFLDLPPQQTMTILLDNGYHKEYLEQEIERIDARLRGRIKIENSAKITPEQKAESKKACPEKNGFVVIKKRWIGGAHECVAQSVSRVMEELRRIAQNK